jgi:hypothetical protein
VIERGQKVQWYRLRREHSYTDLVFLPKYIIITGDTRVKDHGLQALGYGLDWFKKHLEPSYLAEKFLEQTWCPEQARAYFKEIQDHWKATLADHETGVDIEDDDGEEWDEKELQKRNWKTGGQELEDVTIIEALEALLEDEDGSIFSSPGQLYEALPAYGFREGVDDGRNWLWFCPFDTSDGLGGYGYPEHEVGWLAAINRRFSELYKEPPIIKIVGEKV